MTIDVPLQGAPAAPPDENTSTGMDPGLPQGVHPLDRSVPHTPGTNPDHDTPISLTEPGPQGITRPAPWSTDNETALPVYQRSAHDWNVKVLSVEVGNSMTVSYDPVTGFATWNRSGTTAIILI